MNVKSSAGLAALFIALVLGLFLIPRHGASRRESVKVLGRLQAGLAAHDQSTLLEAMAPPEAIRSRSAPEQAQFLRKALLDELSPAGIAALEEHGRFGPLPKIFPDEAEAWARQAGATPDDCVAFRMERNGLRAEVVLVETGNPSPPAKSRYRIVRVNNVRQMADAYP